MSTIDPDTLIIEPYCSDMAETWDSIVDSSRNGTFMLKRGYMDYHSHRFKDVSLLIRNHKSKIIALMAAAVPRGGDQTVVTAHAGLTYGGLIVPRETTSLETGAAIEALIRYYRNQAYSKLVYKPIPHIYHRWPAEDDIYFLVRHGARVEECLLSSTISYPDPPSQNNNTRRNVRKADANGLTYHTADSQHEVEEFYNLLSKTLNDRHNTNPVHTFDELKLLIGRFPENIKIWVAVKPEGRIVAGTVMYFTPTVAHAQYIAASSDGFNTGALSGLFNHLIDLYASNHRFFDFGISTEDHGLYLNDGLVRQKNGFGARGTVTLALTLDL